MGERLIQTRQHPRSLSLAGAHVDHSLPQPIIVPCGVEHRIHSISCVSQRIKRRRVPPTIAIRRPVIILVEDALKDYGFQVRTIFARHANQVGASRFVEASYLTDVVYVEPV